MPFAMYLTTAAKYIRLTFLIKKHSLLGAMEYKFSFFSQILGMVINDILLVPIWGIFFARFPSVNGWTYQDTIQVLIISTASFSIVHIMASGLNKLSEIITKGDLDYYLAFPQDVLWHSVVMGINLSAIGDLIFSIILIVLYIPFTFTNLGLLALAITCSSAILFATLLIYHTITFYVGKFEEAAAQGQEAILSTSMYPQTAFNGFLKILIMTVIPAFFIDTIPQRLLSSFSWSDLFILLAISIGLNIIAILFFRRGLKRYESGNMFQVRV